MTVAEHTHHDGIVILEQGSFAAKQRDAGADVGTLEREIDELV